MIGATVPTRPNPLQRLTRWWQRGQLRAELAGTAADLADNDHLLSAARGAIVHCTPQTLDACTSHYRHVLRDRQMLLARRMRLRTELGLTETGA